MSESNSDHNSSIMLMLGRIEGKLGQMEVAAERQNHDLRQAVNNLEERLTRGMASTDAKFESHDVRIRKVELDAAKTGVMVGAASGLVGGLIASLGAAYLKAKLGYG